MNSQEALDQLLLGNQRYITGHTTSSNTPSARNALVEGQFPIAAIIRCADSRVAPEIIFDQPLGKLFVCGVAGNIPTPEIVQSLEFAVQAFGVSLIVVMGHTECFAVQAAVENEFPEGIFAQIALSPDPDINETIAYNSEQGIETILHRSLFIEEGVKAGAVQIVAGVLEIATGEFELVAQTQLN